MRTKAMLLLLLTAQPSWASELYADVSLGHMWGATPVLEEPSTVGITPGGPTPDRGYRLEESDGPHAAIELGYSRGRASFFLMHASSVSNSRDMGVNFVGVKYRFSARLQ